MEFLREFLGVLADLFLDFLGEGHWRDDAGGVAGVNACGFHVFHDGADNGVLAIADAVHVEFGGVFEEAIDKDWLAFANGGGFFHELAEVLFLIDDHHAAAAENEARANENRVTDLIDNGEGFFDVVGDAFSFGRSRTYMCGRAIFWGQSAALTLAAHLPEPSLATRVSAPRGHYP